MRTHPWYGATRCNRPESLPSMLRWFKTLKFRIVALAVASGVLSALAAAHLVLATTREDMRQMLLTEQRHERVTTAAILGSKLDTLQASMQAVARRADTAAWESDDSMQRFLESLAAAHVLFDNITVARADGAVIARVARNGSTARPPSIATRAYFQQALQTDQPVVSEPIRSLVGSEPIVVIAVSVRGSDGQPLGVIAGALELRSTRLFAELGGDTEYGGRFMVIDRGGRVVAHADPERTLGEAASEPGLQDVFARWRDNGSPIDTNGLAEVSSGHVISMAGIPTSNWVLVDMLPEDIAMGPVIAAQRTGSWAAIGVGVVAALLSGVAAWWLTRPITQLRDSAHALLRDESAPASRWPPLAGELGDLAHAFGQVVAQRQHKQEQTQALLYQLEAVFAHVEVGIAFTRNGRFELVSPRLCQLFGRREDQMLHLETHILHGSREAYDAFSARCLPEFMDHGAFDGEVALVRASGEPFWAHMRGRAIVPGDRSQGTIWTVQDVTHARTQREQLEWNSNHDSLTGLANRAAFDVLIAQHTALADREPFCALFIDLDRFKLVNDTAGHAAGDALLRDVAAQLVAQVRRSDVVARLGGDEFAVILHRCPLGQGRTVAENLRRAVIDYRLQWEGQEHGVGASIGLVSVDGHHADAAEVLRDADAACYTAKQRGRNAVVVHGDPAPGAAQVS